MVVGVPFVRGVGGDGGCTRGGTSGGVAAEAENLQDLWRAKMSA